MDAGNRAESWPRRHKAASKGTVAFMARAKWPIDGHPCNWKTKFENWAKTLKRARTCQSKSRIVCVYNGCDYFATTAK